MKIVKNKMNQLLSAFLVATLLITSIATLASAQETGSDSATTDTAAAPAQSTTIKAKQVTGSLPGGNFSKIWLELQPDSVGSKVKVVADFSTDNPRQDGIGFFILDSNNFASVLGGGSLQQNNVAAGNPSNNTQANQLEVEYNADSVSAYTIVVVNDGAKDVSFTLTATNATIIDGSGQVKDPNASQNAAAAPTTAPAEAAAPEATVAPRVASTDTATTTVEAVATPVATTAPAAAPVVVSSVLRTDKVEGELPNQYDQHFLGLEPSQRDASITVELMIEPQDNSEVLRKVSFLVLNEDGFKRYINGESATDVAIAAGNRVFDGPTNMRVASFKAVGSVPMTIIVYNNSDSAASYTLSAEGATIVDDSGQTMTAQKQSPVSSTATVSGTTASAPVTTTTTAAATTSTTSTSTTATATTARIGSSYTIKSGDSISKIARDVYGDVQLYDELCAYNKIANCDSIEVGDTIQLPAKSELGTGATTSATTTTTAPAAAASTTVSPTRTTTAATAPVTSTTTVTSTAPVTSTTPVTETESVTPTATTNTASNDGTIVEVLQDDGEFSILLDLLTAAGLSTNLDSDGAFTVFAPTDAAFNALPAGAIAQLKRQPQGQLREILLFHVLSNSVNSSDITDGTEATTLQGGTVKFTVAGSQVKVQDSVISPADLEASNGVVHVIDKVMLPAPQ